MNQKGYVNIILVVLVVILAGVVGYLTLVKKSAQPTEIPTPSPIPTSSATPSLSGDRKSIVADGKVLLVIDDDTIFNFFKAERGLCDGYNLTSTPDRKMFCENKAIFKSKTRFTSIVSSLDKIKVGFTIESDTLTPDKVVGIFYPSRATNKIHFLTNYYLGNEFISFSPSGTNFVFQGGCFEAMCGLYIKNSETLANKASLSDSEFADARTKNVTFVRWVSDNEVEYKLGTELKRASF
ncbi:MAG: hypothetical protein AAB491_02595 [Patescibacteria group bacterium]